MDKRKYYKNPKDLINETYNTDAFPAIERKTNPFVMPLNIVKDIDAYDSKHFYEDDWNKKINKNNSNIK